MASQTSTRRHKEGSERQDGAIIMGGQTSAPRRELGRERGRGVEGEPGEEAPFHETAEESRRRDPEAYRGNGMEMSAEGFRGRQMPRGETGIIRTLVEQDNDYVFRRWDARVHTACAPTCLFNLFYSTSPPLFYQTRNNVG